MHDSAVEMVQPVAVCVVSWYMAALDESIYQKYLTAGNPAADSISVRLFNCFLLAETNWYFTIVIKNRAALENSHVTTQWPSKRVSEAIYAQASLNWTEAWEYMGMYRNTWEYTVIDENTWEYMWKHAGNFFQWFTSISTLFYIFLPQPELHCAWMEGGTGCLSVTNARISVFCIIFHS